MYDKNIEFTSFCCYIDNLIDEALPKIKGQEFLPEKFQYIINELTFDSYYKRDEEAILKCKEYIFVMERFLDWYNNPEHECFYDIDGGLGELYNDAVSYAVKNICRNIINDLCLMNVIHEGNKITADSKFIDEVKNLLYNNYIKIDDIFPIKKE